MKTGLKNKIVSLIAAGACAFTFVAGVLPFSASAAGTSTSKWSAQGSAPQNLQVQGSGDVVNLKFTGGDHSSVTGWMQNNSFVPKSKGVFTFKLNVKSMSAWAGIRMLWSNDGNPNPIIANSGVHWFLEPTNDGTGTTYKLTPAQRETADTVRCGEGIVLKFKQEYTIKVDASTTPGTIMFYVDDTKIGECEDKQNNINFDFAPGQGLTLGIAGDGAFEAAIDTALTEEKSQLDTLIYSCETLRDATEASDAPTVGQAPTAAKNTFSAAIDTAVAASAAGTGLAEAITALTTAKSTFEAAIVQPSVNTEALKQAIASAKAILKVLADTNQDYAPLNTLVTEAQAIVDDSDNRDQGVVDAKTTALNEKIAAVKAANLIWNVDLLTEDPQTGVSVKTDKNVTTISTAKTGYTWAQTRLTAPVAATEKLVFSLKEAKHEINQWTNFYITSSVGDNNLVTPGINITFGANNLAEIIEFYGNANPQNVTLAKFSFQNGEDIQFSFEKTEEGKLLIKVDGLPVYESENVRADMFNGETPLYFGYACGANEDNGAVETVVTYNPEDVLSVGMNEFIATGQSGSGSTDKVTVTKNDKVQSIKFGDAMDFTYGIARAIVTGPKINFSFKTVMQGENDWVTILFSNGIEIHAANTPGLAIKVGGDLSVSAAEYGQSGMGGNAVWATDEAMFFTQVGLKMIFNIYEEDGKLVVKVNDTVLTDNIEMTDSLRALLSSPKLSMTVFGASENGSQYDISYINEEDPEPYDEPVEPEEPVVDPEIISLDDSQILVDGTSITILGDLTVGEFLSLISYDESFTIVLYDENGNVITDEDASASEIAVVTLMFGDEEALSYSVNGKTINGPQTGVATYAAAAFLLMVCAAAVLFALKKKAIQK